MNSSSGNKPTRRQHPSVSGTTHLEDSPINMLSIREHQRNQLKKNLNKVRGRKCLVLDEQLTSVLGLIIGSSFLSEECRVEDIIFLQHGSLQTEADAVVYLTWPRVDHMKIIADQIIDHERKSKRKEYYLFVIPRKTHLCERTLSDQGVLGSVSVHEIAMDLFPVDYDLLTCAFDQTLRSAIHGDYSYLHDVAAALMKFQAAFGKFRTINAKGDMSTAIVDIMQRLCREESDVYKFDGISDVAQLVIIDRTVDMITPVLTPRTYTGLIDAIFKIEHSCTEVRKELLGKSSQKGQGLTKKLCLNSSDNVFREIRDINFKSIGPVLREIASRIQAGYDERHGAVTTKQVKNYFQKFKVLQADHTLIETHVNLADSIAQQTTKQMKWKRRMELEFSLLAGTAGRDAERYLDEMIARREPLESVLRFMILTSMCSGGLTSKKFDQFKKAIVQTYGYEHIFTLQNVESLQLIKRYEMFFRRMVQTETGFNWANLRKNLNLLHEFEDDADLSDPSIFGVNDMNAVGSGYAPLSVRLIEAATGTGWRSLDADLRDLPGEMRQTTDRDAKVSSSVGQNTKRVVMAFFVGGVTHAEIAAIRLLEQRTRTRFIIGTTNIAGNDEIMSAFVDRPETFEEFTGY